MSALIDGGDDDIGLCDAIYSDRLPISIYTIGRMTRVIEATTDDIMVLDVARIMPAMGPIIDSAEVIVIVVGEQHQQTGERNNHQQKIIMDGIV